MHCAAGLIVLQWFDCVVLAINGQKAGMKFAEFLKMTVNEGVGSILSTERTFTLHLTQLLPANTLKRSILLQPYYVAALRSSSACKVYLIALSFNIAVHEGRMIPYLPRMFLAQFSLSLSRRLAEQSMNKYTASNQRKETKDSCCNW